MFKVTGARIDQASTCVLYSSRAALEMMDQSNHMGDATMGLYEDLGGAAAVDAAVDIFYRKVLKDNRISRFFAGVDMAKQAAKQKAFLTMAFGGPNNYTGLDMRKAHAPLVKQGLNDSHFDAVVEDLGATLKELKVPDHLIAKVAAIAETTRNDVLGR
jgi:hemoglobin